MKAEVVDNLRLCKCSSVVISNKSIFFPFIYVLSFLLSLFCYFCDRIFNFFPFFSYQSLTLPSHPSFLFPSIFPP